MLFLIQQSYGLWNKTVPEGGGLSFNSVVLLNGWQEQPVIDLVAGGSGRPLSRFSVQAAMQPVRGLFTVHL